MSDTAYLHRDCPVCGADAPREEINSAKRAEGMTFAEVRPYWSGFFEEKVFFSYDRCRDCGLLFAPDYFTPDQLAALYADMAPNMDIVPSAALLATQRGYWAEAKKVAPLDGGFLEIGPDIGYIVRDAAVEGQFDHFWLFEPNIAVHDQLDAAAGATAHTISTAMDDLSIVPDNSVGLAVMVHVLDHVLDPMATLERVRGKLKSGGVLMIVTHNEKSTLRTLMGTKFPPFCLQHPELYNPESMTAMITRAGYASVEVKRSKNYFPIALMVRQAGHVIGLKLDKVPLPTMTVGLKLGNMVTLARR